MNRPRVEDIYPLSPTQQGMLFHALQAPGSGVYFEQLTCELTGDLDAAAFESAWRQVVARHPVLRTAFDWETMDEPVQIVLADPRLPFEHLDWRRLDAAEQGRRLQASLAAERERGFDLGVAPLVRLTLIRTGEPSYRLVWNHHHLILDGWSMPLLFKEFFLHYQAAAAPAAATPAALPPAPRPYRDYIAWLKRQDAAAAETYWRRELAGFSAPTPLACGRPAAARAAGEGRYEVRELHLAAPATAALQAVVQRYRVTLNSLVQACWGLLLSRHCGDPDVAFGVVVSGRPPALAGVEAMVGLFLGTLPLRLAVTPATGLLPFAQQVRDKLADLMPFEFSSLVDVQAWSGVPRGLPLFESIVIFQSYPVEAAGALRDSALRIGNSRVEEHTNYALNLTVRPGTQLGLALSYDSSRFDAAAVEEVLRQLRGLLEQASASPEAPLGSFSLVTDAARRWLPDPAAPLAAAAHDSLPVQFRRAAARQAQAPAVVEGERTWSYGELAAAAAAVAGSLLEADVPHGGVVAVEAPEGRASFGLIGAALGVLEAGAALLFVDGRLPAARRAFMLQKAAARLVLQIGGPLSGEGAPPRVRIDAETGRPAAVAGAAPVAPAPAVEPVPADPAYVCFTSGTTGEPKAVLGCHRGLAHFLDWQRTRFAIGPGDRVAQVTALSFDVVLREIFTPLTAGAALCLREADLEVASPELPAWLARAAVTVLHTVPSLAVAWTALAPGAVRLDRLRCVFFAGEPLAAELVARWRETFDYRGQVINLYGPTETTLAKCWFEVPTPPRPGVQPIGEPLPEAEVHILAEAGRPCGLLEPGEIVLRTPFRTLGYLEPETGAGRRFVPNPFRPAPAAPDPGAPEDLLYRSGDIGRRGADGVLEILGRRDGQLKVRGVRVEPAEIERALRRHPDVRDVAIVAIKDPRGNRLAAYVVPRPAAAAALTAEALARVAREALPEPLVPSHFVLLPALPLTAHGKLDRDALPPPAAGETAAPGRRVPPRDWIELAVAAIFEDVLGTSPVGVTDSFFALGGHSLLVAPLLARVERRFQQKIALAAFLPAPTVERLAMALRTRAADLARSPLLPIVTQGDAPPLFFVHPLAGSALCYVELARRLARRLPEQPFYGLDEQFLAGTDAAYATLEDLAAAYVAAVREVRPIGPYHLGGWSFGGVLAFEMARQLAAQGADVQLVALLDSHLPATAVSPAVPAVPGPAAADPVDDATIIVELLGPDLDLTEAELRRLTPEAQLRHLVDLGRRAQVLPPDLDEPAIRHLMAIIHMNGRLLRAYRPQPYPGRLTYFRAALEHPAALPEAPLAAAAPAAAAVAAVAPADTQLDRWRALSTEPLDVHSLPSHHRTMVAPPHVEALAEALANCLAAVPAL